MKYRTLGRLGFDVSEVGYGMWGTGGTISGWTAEEEDGNQDSLMEAVKLGCNFFDTAWIYGRGHSERLLGSVVRKCSEKKIFCATKIPPKDRMWPSSRKSTLDDCFPPDHIREYTEKSVENIGVDTIDLMQFHVWEDSWTEDERWQRAIDDLKSDGLLAGVGISVNRWEPWNGIKAIRTGLIDVVQVIYNIFDQAPEDELFPICEEMNIGVIARVPLDEGSLIGNLTLDSTWPGEDFRNKYFGPENLPPTLRRIEELKKITPNGMNLPELALHFILNNRLVSTVIPGMRKIRNVRANMAVSDGRKLDDDLIAELRRHRWDRKPTYWSD